MFGQEPDMAVGERHFHTPGCRLRGAAENQAVLPVALNVNKGMPLLCSKPWFATEQSRRHLSISSLDKE